MKAKNGSGDQQAGNPPTKASGTVPPRTGGQLLVDALLVHGVDTVFCVPGESYLGALDALHDAPSIRTIVCRQEGGASMMAEAYGKLTGRPGICFVSRGPGATNASSGLHIAQQDGTPLVMFIGQVGRDSYGRRDFQELDYHRVFGSMAKLVVQIERADRVQEFVNRAFQVASSGRPGPVVVSLPEDMLTDLATAAPIKPYVPVRIAPDPKRVEDALSLLQQARRPVIMVGGSTWTLDATARLQAFAEACVIPVATTYHCQDLVDNDSPAYVGCVGVETNPDLFSLVQDADVVLVLGSEINEIVSRNFSLLGIPVPHQTLIHVLPEAEGIGRLHQPAIGIASDLTLFSEAIAKHQMQPSPGWAERLKTARASYLKWCEAVGNPGGVNLSEVVLAVGRHAGPRAIVCGGAGNYMVWVQRFTRFHEYRSQLGSTSGSMGYGIPSAVVAALLHPDRPVIAYAGDGCLMMTVQELAAIRQYGLNMLILVSNNGLFGTIRMHQEREFPGRAAGTTIVNPDFVTLARAFGMDAERIERTDEIEGAIERWTASGRATLLELVVDPDASTPKWRLSEVAEIGARPATKPA